ncbi:MAG: two-component system, OmpR family, sensor histidine kinase MtrB [Actinomycetota bacterium]|nr:two-component system, OmpR family, sensor histidine kinase MtrB [Actinomycetota bacterium]
MAAEVARLAAATELQRGFVANVSHELRTPLTTIQMASEVLYESRGEFSADARRAAELLADQVERFELLLADLLEISRFDAGAADLLTDAVEVRAVVADVVTAARPLADTRQAHISLAPGPAVVLEADRVRLERIVRNLVVNAVSYGGAGVDVVITVDPTGGARSTSTPVGGIGPGRVPEPLPAGAIIAVADDGPGLPADPGRVFDRFWRADPSRARDTGGAGLGLAIAAEDVGLHGGFLRALANAGGGATFVVWLPAARDSASSTGRRDGPR